MSLRKRILVLFPLSKEAADRFLRASRKLKVDAYFAVQEHGGAHQTLKELEADSGRVFGFRSLEEAETHYKTSNLSERFDAVVPGGEYCVPSSDRLCAAAGLSRSLNGQTCVVRDKSWMRRVASRAGISQPKVLMTFSKPCQIEALKDLNYPVVVKPTDRCGGQQVRICAAPQQAEAAVLEILKPSRSSTTGIEHSRTGLIEELVGGSEYSAECVVKDGDLQTVLITKKFTDNGDKCVEIGHLAGVHLKQSELRDIELLCSQIVTSFGVNSAVLHVEFKIADGELYLIEVAARIAGGLIPRIHELHSGHNLEMALISIKLGLEPRPIPFHYRDHLIGVRHLRSPDLDFTLPPVLTEVENVVHVPCIADTNLPTSTSRRLLSIIFSGKEEQCTQAFETC